MPRRRRKSWTFYLAVMSIILALIFSAMSGWVLSHRPVEQSTAPSTPRHTSLAWPVIKNERPQESLPTTRPLNIKRCAVYIGQFVPVRLVVEQVGIDVPLTAQPLDKDKALPVPVVNFASSGAWWMDGAQPGAYGAVYIGVHTYSSGFNATGNKVLRVAPGAIAKLYDANGVVGACYLFQGDRINMSSLAVAPPPESYRTDGQPGLSIMTCDGFDPKLKDFTIRAYFLWAHIW